MLAVRHGLGAHGIRLYEENRRRWLELHLEVQESLTLDEAHRQASVFEQDLRAQVPGLTRIVSHLEPTGDATAIIQAESARKAEVCEALEDFFRQHQLSAHLHKVKVQWAGGELQVSFHCRLDAATRITDAHEVTVKAEEFLRGRIPHLGRVVIHVEPTKGAV
jgi:divalent metal cation (Fe/Co/Zn/Cd) transporter